MELYLKQAVILPRAEAGGFLEMVVECPKILGIPERNKIHQLETSVKNPVGFYCIIFEDKMYV